MKIKLGTKVRCKLTGFTGIATSRTEYINGCVRYGVQGPVAKDKPEVLPDSYYIDEQSLEVLKDKVEVKSSKTGGPNIRVAAEKAK